MPKKLFSYFSFSRPSTWSEEFLQEYVAHWAEYTGDQMAKKYGVVRRTINIINAVLGLTINKERISNTIRKAYKKADKRKRRWDAPKIGDITIRKLRQALYPNKEQKWIYTIDGWVTMHHYNWCMEHGPLEKGWIILFKDGNQGNQELGNLEITRRGYNMRKHGDITNQQIIEKKQAKIYKYTNWIERRNRGINIVQIEKLQVSINRILRIKRNEELAAEKLKIKEFKKAENERLSKTRIEKIKLQKEKMVVKCNIKLPKCDLIAARKKQFYESKKEKRREIKKIDYSNLRLVKVDKRTAVYAKPEETDQMVIDKYYKHKKAI